MFHLSVEDGFCDFEASSFSGFLETRFDIALRDSGSGSGWSTSMLQLKTAPHSDDTHQGIGFLKKAAQ